MKFLICGINFAPDLIGIAKYTTEMAVYLAEKGHEVRVVTAPPYYPAWRIPPEFSRYFYSRDAMGRVQITRCPLYVPPRPNGWRRLLHHVSFAITSAPIIIKEALAFRPDIVFFGRTILMSAPAALFASRLSNSISWLHIQDFEIDAAFNLGLLATGKKRRQIASLIERSLLRGFDRVSSISKMMTSKLVLKGVAPANVFEFRNWVDTSAIKPGLRDNEFRKLLNISSDATVVLYAGNMANKQGLECLTAAAGQLAEVRDDIVFLFAGAGEMRERMFRETKGLPNVHFLDLQPLEKLSVLLATADIHVLPQRRMATDLVLPSKMSGMLASGRPIIAMAESGSQIADEVKDCGIVVPPEDVTALVQSIQSLADDANLREQLGLKAREAAIKAWNMQTIIDRFIDDTLPRPDTQSVNAEGEKRPLKT